MDQSKKARKILSILLKEYPHIDTALIHKNPLELLVATILSAQCTDKRVNKVTKELFRKYRTAGNYANASQKSLEQEIRSTGFYRNKARNIIAMARMLVGNHGGKVPKTMEELVRLSGVARKTANIVLSKAYGINEGIAIDTHNIRLTYRLGLTKSKDPKKIEQDIMKLVPRKDWDVFSLIMVEHGRSVCKAPTPFCSRCIIKRMCPKNGVARHH